MGEDWDSDQDAKQWKGAVVGLSGAGTDLSTRLFTTRKEYSTRAFEYWLGQGVEQRNRLN